MAVEVGAMATIALSDILDDLRATDQALRKFEQRYWISSDIFYELYSQGLLDDGENLEDFSEWAGFYKIKQHREELLRQFSRRRITEPGVVGRDGLIYLTPQEPLIEVSAQPG
jgi:hypothetical protein